MSSKLPPHVQKDLSEATLKYAYREFQEAIKLLLEVVRVAPGVPHAYHMLGLIYEEIGQVPKALKLFMMAAHLSKRDVTSWRNLAALCKKHGESQQCIYCLQRVLAITPDDKDAQWERAMLLSELGEHRKAAKAMLPLLRAHPDNADLVRRLVRSYHRLGYTGKAIYLLDELATKKQAPAAPAAAAAQQDSNGAGSSDAGGSSSSSQPQPAQPQRTRGSVDFHSLNMLLELLLETGKYREGLQRVQHCRRVAYGITEEDDDDESSDGDGGNGGGRGGRSGKRNAAAAAALAGGWKFPIEIQVREGICHAYLGDLEEAQSCWETLLKGRRGTGYNDDRSKGLADLLHEVAYCYFGCEKYDKALELYMELSANPLYTHTVRNRSSSSTAAHTRLLPPSVLTTLLLALLSGRHAHRQMPDRDRKGRRVRRVPLPRLRGRSDLPRRHSRHLESSHQARRAEESAVVY